MQGRRNDSSSRELPRLPAIAPRHVATLASSDASSGQLTEAPSASSRSRLPPRSRSGCWTCRMRKVKCDEQRPTCGQCLRLGHECDYNPRLTFRDDTPRVIERMADVRTSGSSVWDPASSAKLFSSRYHNDRLPEFSALTSDEEREQKAEYRDPGTYLVVANPSSFSNLPEYRDENVLQLEVSPIATQPQAGLFPASPTISSRGGEGGNEDPNVVILRVFEDTPPRVAQLIVGPSSLPSTFSPSAANFTDHQMSTSLPEPIVAGLSRIYEARNGGRDSQLLQYYRRTISPAVIQVGHSGVVEDIFEIEAHTFPPLFHAMMAISALSIANRNSLHQADALEHYQQVIPAIRGTISSEEDSVSNGALFTHYLLLLYEIANSGPWQSNMWQQHCDRLLSIVTARQQTGEGVETQPFVVWRCCLVDVYALLSGSGTGKLVQAVLNNGIVPPAQILPPLAPGMSQHYFSQEADHFPIVLELNQHVVSLAVRLGVSARSLREETVRRRSSGASATAPENLYLVSRQNRSRTIQNLCRELDNSWLVTYARYWPRYSGPGELPPRVQGILEHSRALYNAIVIYSHTSMHPEQNYYRPPEAVAEISASVAEILTITRHIISEQRWNFQYLTLPLFLAGYASQRSDEKAMAYNLLDVIEQHSYGKNSAVTKQFLGIIYNQQAAIADQGMDIDWIEEMRRQDMKLVIFGE